MKRIFAVVTFAAISTVVPAYADIFTVNFQGLVNQTQGATGQALGNVVSGSFDLDSASGRFIDFSIAGRSVASGFTSSATLTPPYTDALYTAQISPVATGGTVNSTYSLDLSSLTFWPNNLTAYSLLRSTTQLTTNLDTINTPGSSFPSTFGYYTANINGTNVVSLTANLTSVTATATPEPASVALLGGSLLALTLYLRRRRVD